MATSSKLVQWPAGIEGTVSNDWDLIVQRLTFSAATLMVLANLSGCNPYKEIAPVHGQVKLKDKPLSGVVVVLTPVGGRPSYGRTNSEGRFEMESSPNDKGVKVGTVKVSFDPFSGEATGNPFDSAPSPEVKKLPKRYFSSFMDFKVEPKKNVLDIIVEP